MKTFIVSAWPIDTSEQIDEPEWEVSITANLLGVALEQGELQFRAYCKEHELDRSKFEVHASNQ